MLSAWFAFEDRQWSEAAAGFEAARAALGALDTGLVNADRQEDLASWSFWRCRALLALGATESALAEAEQVARSAVAQVGEAGAAARWARAAQIFCLVHAGRDDAAVAVAALAVQATSPSPLAEITFGEAIVRMSAAQGDWRLTRSAAVSLRQIAEGYFGQTSPELLWTEALAAVADTALAAGRSVDGPATLQRIRDTAARGDEVSPRVAADLDDLYAWTYDRLGAQFCENDNMYRITSRWARIRDGEYWLCSGDCQACDRVIVQRRCPGDCLQPCSVTAS